MKSKKASGRKAEGRGGKKGGRTSRNQPPTAREIQNSKSRTRISRGEQVATRKSDGRTAVVPMRQRRLSFGDKWDYAPAPESFEYIKIPPRHELFINGEFVAPHSGRYFESV